MKTCTKCKIEKPSTEFYNTKKNKDGKSYYCKECNREYYYKCVGRLPRISSTKAGYKICSKCKVEKVLKEFHKQKKGKFGVAQNCKHCIYLRDVITRGTKLRKPTPKKGFMWCLHCNTQKLLESFPNRTEQKNGKRSTCFSCYNAKRKKGYITNRENILSLAKTYKKRKGPAYLNALAKKYKVQKIKANFIKTELQKFVAQEMYDLAQIRKPQTGFDWHVDHIKPLSKGGKHAISNLQVVPATWNLSKGNRNNNIFKIGG